MIKNWQIGIFDVTEVWMEYRNKSFYQKFDKAIVACIILILSAHPSTKC